MEKQWCHCSCLDNVAGFYCRNKNSALAAALALLCVAIAGCATTHKKHKPEHQPEQIMNTPMIPQANQFNTNEAMAMIEFCIDLDNQDDLLKTNPLAINRPRQDRINEWTLIDDSRTNFARNRQLDKTNWNDPTKNGFGDFDSAWTLWKLNTDSNKPPVYALAFRGTVFANKASAIEDALATTVVADHGIECPKGKFLPITFAKLPRAEVHEGFAYALFEILFDYNYGALKALQNIPTNSTLIITGHSQGAALATLAHAFFYYAAQEKRFGIAEKNLTLRSYVFAQPKPGNMHFAMDFANITGGGANSFVFNNTLDPVPMLPPTHLFFAEAFEDLPSMSIGWKTLQFVNNTFNWTRSGVSKFFSYKLAGKIKRVTKKHKHGVPDYYMADKLVEGSKRSAHWGVSQAYASAGYLIPLRGLRDGFEYYHVSHAEDDFVQHHATSYRRLMEKLYGLPPTEEPPATVANK